MTLLYCFVYALIGGLAHAVVYQNRGQHPKNFIEILYSIGAWPITLIAFVDEKIRWKLRLR